MINVLFFIVDEKQSINRKCIGTIETQIDNKSGDELYLVIQSYGGDPFSAVRCMRLLQKRFKKIIIIIPNHAMSAGTLMALGGDEIYMSEKSMLGPLDLPIEHPKDGSRISALDVQNTITTIASLSDTIADQRFQSLRDNNALGKVEASRLAYESATSFVEPIVSQIDPYHLQKSYRELRIGWYYAYDLLRVRMMKDDALKAWKTAKALVNNYPAHEYGIFADEAINMLKLNVKELGLLDKWKIIKPEFDRITSSHNRFIKFKEMKDDVIS